MTYGGFFFSWSSSVGLCPFYEILILYHVAGDYLWFCTQSLQANDQSAVYSNHLAQGVFNYPFTIHIGWRFMGYGYAEE